MKRTFTFKGGFPPIISGILFLVAYLASGSAFAQIPASSYGFSASAGTFTELTGANAVTAIHADDALSGALPIGFTFNYCGVDYTQFKVSSNGWLTFNTAVTGSFLGNSQAELNSIKPALYPLWDDLGGQAGPAASYLTTGTAPNRVFTMEYKNWKWTFGSAATLSIQVKLFETTNVIQYVYRQEAAGNTGTTASIGICDGGAVPTYLSLNNTTATPTASSTVFTTGISTRPATGQVYQFTPPPNCNTLTPPTAVTAATAAPATICLSGSVTLGIATPMPAATGLTYQWQSATVAAGPYTTIANTTTNSYAATINASSFFRCRVLCNYDSAAPFWVSTPSPQVVVNNPGTPAGIAGNRCGPGAVLLGATPPAASPTATLNWYTAPTGGAPVGTGANYTTPFLTATTNFYVAASAGGFSGPQTLSTITTGGNNCTGGVMFDLDPNVAIAVDSFKTLANVTANGAVINVYTKTGTYLGNETNAAAWTLFTTVTVNTVANQMFNITLPTPINITSGNITGIYINYNSAYTSLAGPQTYSNADLDIITGAGLCNLFGGLNPNRGFNGSVHYRTAGCEGNRAPVTATVNASPVVAKTAPAVVCNDAVATITLTPPTPAYPNYTWTPTTNLYTNAAATIPYTGGSATTVYMKTTNVGQQTYYMMAGNPLLTTGCTFADTVKIWSQPGNVTINGQPDTICVSGTTILSLDTIAGYYPGSIQWGTSGNNTLYTDISGATNPTYTTPTLSFGQNTYYRAQIKAGTQVCESPFKYVVIANPTIISAPDSFNCGPGTVTLSAVTGGNGTPVWYENATGGSPIATGSPFVTPFLAATTSYYLASGGGGSAGTHAIGAGALNGAGTYSPFIGGWGGRKHQFLIKAAELTAAGIPPGAKLSSLAFDVTAGAGTIFPGFTVSIKPTTANSLAPGFENGLTEVRVPTAHTLTAGINTLTFTNTFTWDGTSNLIIQTCWSNGTNTSAAGSVKFDNIVLPDNVVTRCAQADLQTPANICAMAGGATVTQRPQMILSYDNRCESAREEVIAYIHPQPIVDLGGDINQCVDEGAIVVLDAGVQPNGPQFFWDNTTTSQVRAIDASGTYNVIVTNQYTCKGYDTINVILRQNPVVELGNDTTVCNGVTLNIDAGNDGIEYFWNTGSVSQTINVITGGSYNVFVTNAEGCIKADTIIINMQGELPSIQGINISNNGQHTFHFTAVNPQNVIGYEWDFGDGSTPSYAVSPVHTYIDGGNYVVTLRLSSTCGFLDDTTSAHIVGINQINIDNNELTVYPNPTRDQATILNKGALKMEKVEIYNVLGQIVYSAEAESKDKHTIRLGNLASGVYTIQIFTDKGNVARKLEILK